ncbi:hypothetical protein D9M68_714780 [compost metagenome]
MHRQLLLPVPHVVAERDVGAELVVQADLGDAVDVAQRLAELEARVVVQPAREGLDDLALGETRAARAAHGQDEREAELGVVVGVELLDLRELFGRAVGQAGLVLLVGRLGGERLADHGLAGELGVGADQADLLVGRRRGQRLHQRVLEMRERAEGALHQRALRDPGRVFVHAVEHGDGSGRPRGVELGKGEERGAHDAAPASKGCACFQWRAMSTRRQTQTLSCVAM